MKNRYEPFEVTEKQYNICMNVLSGIVAGRTENGKYYLKIMCFTDYANKILTQII